MGAEPGQLNARTAGSSVLRLADRVLQRCQAKDSDAAKATPSLLVPLSPYVLIIVLTVMLTDVDDLLRQKGIPTNTWSEGNPVYDLRTQNMQMIPFFLP